LKGDKIYHFPFIKHWQYALIVYQRLQSRYVTENAPCLAKDEINIFYKNLKMLKIMYNWKDNLKDNNCDKMKRKKKIQKTTTLLRV
jgi:hypothetical protein